MMFMGESSFCEVYISITMALRVSGIHCKSGFETGRSSDCDLCNICGKLGLGHNMAFETFTLGQTLK